MEIVRKTEEVLLAAKEERKILHNIKGRKSKRISHILHRHRLLKHVTKGNI
jgi:hypothetical protein